MTIREALDDLKVEYAEAGNNHCRPGWIQLERCPFCSSQSYHLGFNLQGQYFNCWKCGYHNVVSVLLRLGVGFDDAKALYKALDISPESADFSRIRKGLVEPAGIVELQSAHKRYLKRRGFVPQDLQMLWNLKGIGIASRLSWRIYIPITYRGVVVSWTTRAIGDRVTQRYVSASAGEEAINHKDLIYGSDYILHSVIIVEGPTDCWAIGPGAGGVFGTAFSSSQVKKLVKIPYRFICFDSSPEAQQRAEDLAGQLALFPGKTENIQLDAKDPGSATKKEINLLRKAAKLI